ncbi:amidohydrolase family protein [Frankia sp. EI5c]|uniref:amidohydrolase family protein n=1 Tax=Frankia sp. EI5c TaxID=683316 RepID=UPI000824C8CA
MIWANSGDSHLLEPADLFFERMPRALAERMPRSVKDPDGAWETLHIDGNSFRRRLPTRPLTDESGLSQQDKAPGAFDPVQRLKDLDREGIWAELIYPSISMWTSSLTDPDLLREGVRVINDWAMEFQAVSPRFVCTAHLPLLSIPDAVAEVRRTHEMGFRAAFFPVEPPPSQPRFNQDEWEPLWAALEETGLVMAVHIGTEAHDAGVINGQYHRGPGGAVLNYFETSFGGQRIAAQMITSGALDRHPGLRVMISEGGATWGPFLADRMDEGYRQHSSAVRPRLSRLPSEFLFSQVYASFQHDSSAVAAMSAMGWNNVCWGSDYPHIEGTFGHTQKTLAGLFDGADIAVRDRITVGTFEELFPHVPPVPGERLP